MREKYIEDYFCKKVKSIGGLCLKLVFFSGAGFPDRTVLVHGGRIVFVEFKTPKGKLSKLQEYYKRKLTGLGFVYIVCRSTAVADTIIDMLKS